MSSIQELLDDINIIRKSLEALHHAVTELSKRAQAQGKHLTRAELDEGLAKAKAETKIYYNIPYEEVMSNLQRHLTTPAKVEAALEGGLQRLAHLVNKVPSSVPIKGEVWGFTNWKIGALSVATPLVLLVLLLWFPSVFSRVPKDQFERVQTHAQSESARADRLMKTARQATAIGRFYQKQIRHYLQKNPKSARNFPEYVLPKLTQTPQQ